MNPGTQAYQILTYLLAVAEPRSHTWAAYVRGLFIKYNLPDPLVLLSATPWPKCRWKSHIKIAVTSYHESVWRQKSSQNSKLEFLNVKASGLSGKVHPALSWVMTAYDVNIIRPHLRMLAGDYPSYASISQSGSCEPYCRLCSNLGSSGIIEDIMHILIARRATKDTRSRVTPDLLNTVADHFPTNKILVLPSPRTTTQFIIDCSSLNLDNGTRISQAHPAFTQITKQCSSYIFAIHSERLRQLRRLGHVKY